MTLLRAWLRLLRFAALPTALADVWLGAGVVGLLQTWTAVWLSLVSLALYAAGMILNDVHDVDDDRRDNPGRPLVLGQISVRTAGVVGFALLAAAVGGAATLGILPFAVAGVLAVLIVTYNFALKATAVGPLNMGLCRAFNVFLGMSVIPPALAGETGLSFAAALPVLVYVTSVTYLSRLETTTPRRQMLVLPSIGIVCAAALVVLLACTAPSLVVPGYAVLVSVLVTVCVALLLGRIWLGSGIRGAVAAALMGIIPLEALVGLGYLSFPAPLCILLLLVPVVLLRRLSHIT